jgi:hypothetical protein
MREDLRVSINSQIWDARNHVSGRVTCISEGQSQGGHHYLVDHTGLGSGMPLLTDLGLICPDGVMWVGDERKVEHQR